MSDSIFFRELASRLLAHLREKVRRGELTERGLARLTAYSQPHIHNVLKGARGVQIELADQIMTLLDIPVLSLFSQEELGGRAPSARPAGTSADLLVGTLGAGRPYPRIGNPAERLGLRGPHVAGAVQPVAVRVSREESAMSPLICPGDVILLDRSPQERTRPRPDYVYAVNWRNRGYLGRCLLLRETLIVVADNPSARPQPPERISLKGARLLDIVQGKVVWLGREMDFLQSRPLNTP
ncbi:MAG TPA: hypothetical protein VML01_08415 [Bryobacterales bacterium]|nr:hypothetical protein [Bryobacterales bacterium]